MNLRTAIGTPMLLGAMVIAGCGGAGSAPTGIEPPRAPASAGPDSQAAPPTAAASPATPPSATTSPTPSMQQTQYPGTTYGAVSDPCALVDLSPLVPDIFGTPDLTDAPFTDSRWNPRAGGTTMHCAKLAGGEYQGDALDGQIVFSIYAYADPSKIKKDFTRIRKTRIADLKSFGMYEGYTTIRRSGVGNPAWGLYKADEPDPALSTIGREYVLVFIDDNMLMEFSLDADRPKDNPFPMSHEAFRAQVDAVIESITRGLR